ncbi:hypothetical protein, partial [Halorhodospira neutriphila]|uniref:primosomal protein N' family DNA-binding protein n=1 Tax=Halorhodospira neutriphila TaxID=168379 RepID=UPI0019052898
MPDDSSGQRPDGHPRACGASGLILHVAVPRPLHGGLDYRPPPGPLPAEPVGCRVAVPLGRGRAVGVVVATRHGSEVAG